MYALVGIRNSLHHVGGHNQENNLQSSLLFHQFYEFVVRKVWSVRACAREIYPPKQRNANLVPRVYCHLGRARAISIERLASRERIERHGDEIDEMLIR